MKLELLIVLQITLMLLAMFMLIQLTQLKKQITQTIREVKEYIAFITEDINGETEDCFSHLEKEIGHEVGASDVFPKSVVRNEKEQSQIIHAVLQEYFP